MQTVVRSNLKCVLCVDLCVRENAIVCLCEDWIETNKLQTASLYTQLYIRFDRLEEKVQVCVHLELVEMLWLTLYCARCTSRTYHTQYICQSIAEQREISGSGRISYR